MRKFAAQPKRRTFYDRRVRHEGYTRSLSLGRIIPKAWQYVRITPLKMDAETIIIEIKRLWGENKNEHKTAGENKK